MAATTTAEAPRGSVRRRLAGSLWRHPKAQLGLLLAGPIGWLVIAYLGSLAVLFAAAFWHLDTFSGQVVQGFSLENFRTLAEEGVYRSIVANFSHLSGLTVEVFGEAYLAYARAVALTDDGPERRFLERRLGETAEMTPE